MSNRYQRVARYPSLTWAGLTLCIALATSVTCAWADDMDSESSHVIGKVLPAVVSITVSKDLSPQTPAATGVANVAEAVHERTSPNIKSYVGSGFVIDPSGLIVTNYHVVENAFRIMVAFSDGTLLNGKTLSASRLADIAVVKVEPASPLPAVHWGDSDKLMVGDQVFAAGNPFGVGLSVSAGIVSALNRDIQNSPYDNYIQTDATINHGNSGGPLIDEHGDVVGVDSAIISPTTGSAGIGFALPANSAHFVVDRLLRYGWLRPSWVGIKLQQITPELGQALKLSRTNGSLVAWVVPGSPAARAGISVGDIITRFERDTPTDDRALLRDIARTPAGETIGLMVQQGGQERSVKIVTEEWPKDQWQRMYGTVAVVDPDLVIPPNLGLTLSAMPDRMKDKMAQHYGGPGVMISDVLPDSDASRQGIGPGDVILRLHTKPVTTPEEVQAEIDAARNESRGYIAMLILPKVQNMPGPKWVGLQLGPPPH